MHSNDDTHQAYTAGTIILEETTVIDPSQTISELTNSVFPIIVAILGIAIPLIFIKYIMRILEKILSGF